jgi:hypothetical protein
MGSDSSSCLSLATGVADRVFRRAMIRLLPCLVLAASAVAAERVVINEIHYDPAEKLPLEFIELTNAGDAPAHLAGWALDKFIFPADTDLAPGAFLVVAQDPAALERQFGVKALGPMPGKLSNNGEKITLHDAAGNVVEQIRYGVGFPWPSASAGLGSSLERIHPALDGTQPSSWRASGFGAVERKKVAPLLPSGSAQWHWRKGTSEASQPTGAWRAKEFAEGKDWQAGKAGFGYADDDDATVLGDMAGRYSSIFLRHRLNVAKVPATLLLRVRVDDGCIIWINGKEAARLHMPAGEPRFNSLAQDHEAGDWENAAIANAAQFLTTGDNVVAVQVFNSALNSSDLSFDLSVEDAATASPAAGKRPTPGARNSVFADGPGPAFVSVKHEPLQPKPGEAVKIIVTVTARAATLHAQFVEPGAYLRKSDPEYETRWQDFPMRADGSTWVAELPADAQKNRRLVRYRITAEDAGGTTTRVPYRDDPVPNFAYFVWAGPPAWTAASQPGRTPPLTFSGEMQRTLPTFILLANAQEVSRSQWNGSANHQRFLGTFVCDGTVLDHMQFNNRGSASTYQAGKNKWGFHFPPAHELAMRDQWGKPYAETWNSFAMNACASPWVQINRGMAGLDEAISFRAYQLAGVPASDCLPISFRVVTTAEEQGRTQYDGDLWGLYNAIEDPDAAWLDNHHLPDGIVFKPEDGVKHRPGALAKDPNAVWNEFSGGPRGPHNGYEKWWREHMDLPAYYSFQAINRLISNVDLRPGANHAFYQHPERGWAPVPWDLDMQFIPRTHQPGYIDQIRCLDVPAIRIEYQNRGREILDLLGSDPAPDGGQIGQLVAEYARLIEPRANGAPPTATGAPANAAPKPSADPNAALANPQEWSWAALDMCRWNHAPQTSDKGAFFRNPTSQGMMGGNFSRTLATPDFAGFCKYVVDFSTDSRPKKDYRPNDGNPLGYGYGHLLSECRDSDAPARPTIRQTADLEFAASDFADAQGANTFAAIQWRIAEIGRPAGGPWLYEINALWLSDPLPASGVKVTLPAGLTQAGHKYRVRARYQDNTGRWGHWSEAVAITGK